MSAQMKSFSPSPELIQAADTLFVAMAQESLIREKVEAYESRILSENEYLCDEKYAEHGKTGRITDRKLTYLMRQDHWDDFYAKSRAEAIAHKLPVSLPENDPLPEIEHLRMQAENAFLDLLQPITTIDRSLLSLNERAKVLDLSLRLMAPFVDPHKRFNLPNQGAGEAGQVQDDDVRPRP